MEDFMYHRALRWMAPHKPTFNAAQGGAASYNAHQAAQFLKQFKKPKKNHVIIFGPPGCGKESHAATLCKEFGLVHIATGNLLRSEVQHGTETGIAAKSFMEKGEIVPEEIVGDLILRRLRMPDAVGQGWLLDGAPRSPEGAAKIVKNDLSITIVLLLEVKDEILLSRIGTDTLTRGKALVTDAVLRHRLSMYHRQKDAVMGFFRNKVVRVDASHVDPLVVTGRVMEAMNKYKE